MADEEDLFANGGGGCAVKALDLAEPFEIDRLPCGAFAIQRAAGAAAGYIYIVREIGYIFSQPYFKLVELEVQVVAADVFTQQFPDTTHALVGLPFIKVEDRYSNAFLAVHYAKLRVFGHRDGRVDDRVAAMGSGVSEAAIGGGSRGDGG
jgi:hypothetical protein